MCQRIFPVDFTYKTAHSEQEDGVASVDVLPRCECGAARWFMCKCEREGVRYTGAGIDQTGAPCLEFLRAIVQAHPRCDYVFTPYPAHLRERAQAILNGCETL